MIKKVKKKEAEKETLLDKIEKDLAKDNIYMPEYSQEAEEYLVLPSDLTEVTSKELGKFMHTFTKQKIWIRTVINRTEIVIKDLNRQLDIIKSKIYLDLPVKMAVKEKELHLLSNTKAEKILEELLHWESKLRVLNDVIISMEEGIFTISREITRRSKDFEEEERGENISWKRKTK